MMYGLKVKKAYLEGKTLENPTIIVEDGFIRKIITEEESSDCHVEVLDMSKYIMLPGLIDTHIHGGNSFDTMDGTFRALNEISKYSATRGITSFIPTTITDDVSKIKAAVKNVKDSIGKVEGAEIIGSYVEGPYITKEHKGAHPEKLIKHIELEEIMEILEVGGDTVKTITIAPEKENSIESIRFIRNKNVNVSIGHTNATYDETKKAIDEGANISVHTYNGMRGLNHREPAVLGAVLTEDKVYAEVIADMIHVHPVAIDILVRCKGKDKIILISDCMRAGGLDDGEYMLGTLKVIVKNGEARIESGSLAGSTVNILKAVKNMIKHVKVRDIDAINMASINPAKMLKMDNLIGSIKEGKKANLILVDDDFNIEKTIVEGRFVFEK